MLKKFFNLFKKEPVNTENCEKVENKVLEIDENCTDEQYASAKAIYDTLNDMAQQINNFIKEMDKQWEYQTHKTLTISERSTDNEYPSAKAVHDAIQEAMKKE